MGLNTGPSANVGGGGGRHGGLLWNRLGAEQRRPHDRSHAEVAFLGAAFALCRDGASGLRVAMLAGGSVLLMGAMIAWGRCGDRRPSTRPTRCSGWPAAARSDGTQGQKKPRAIQG
jgi:hypothetical protein